MNFRGFQERSIEDTIADPEHGLILDPGLGKTLIILATFARLREACEAERLLVVAPKLVAATTWPDEMAKWESLIGPLTHQVLTTKTKQIFDRDITLINPEALPWLFGSPDEFRRKWDTGVWAKWGMSATPRPDMYYVDELHHFKKASGVRARTLFRFRDKFFRWHGGTGSIAPNGYHDLHGQLKLLDGGAALGKGVGAFERKYFDAVRVHRHRVAHELKDGAAEQIQAAIAPRLTCLIADDWLELPALVRNTVDVDLPPAVRKQYELMEEEVILGVPDGDVLFAEEAKTAKLRQICGGHVYTAALGEDNNGEYDTLHNQKIKALQNRLEAIGQPTIVVYEFLHDSWEIGKALGNPPVLGGVTSDTDARRIIRDWNAGKYPVLLMYPAEGLNLQAGGHHLIWYTPPWDWQKFDQMNRRLRRQGQESDTVCVDLICARNTVEQRVCRVLKHKGEEEFGLKRALTGELT